MLPLWVCLAPELKGVIVKTFIVAKFTSERRERLYITWLVTWVDGYDGLTDQHVVSVVCNFINHQLLPEITDPPPPTVERVCITKHHLDQLCTESPRLSKLARGAASVHDVTYTSLNQNDGGYKFFSRDLQDPSMWSYPPLDYHRPALRVSESVVTTHWLVKLPLFYLEIVKIGL